MRLQDIENQIGYLNSQLVSIPNPPQTMQQQQAIMQIQQQLQYYHNMRAQAVGQIQQQQQQVMMQNIPTYQQQPVSMSVQQPMMYQQQSINSPFQTFSSAQQPTVTTPTSSPSASRYGKRVTEVTTTTQQQVVEQPVKQEPAKIKWAKGHEYPLLCSDDKMESLETMYGETFRGAVKNYDREVKYNIKLNPDHKPCFKYHNPHTIYDSINKDDATKYNTFFCNAIANYKERIPLSKESMEICAKNKNVKLLSKDEDDIVKYIKDVVKLYNSDDTRFNLFVILLNNVTAILNDAIKYRIGSEVKIDHLMEDFEDLVQYVEELELVKTRDSFREVLQSVVNFIKNNIVVKDDTLILYMPTILIDDWKVNDYIKYTVKDDTYYITKDSFTDLYNVIDNCYSNKDYGLDENLPISLITLEAGNVQRYNIVKTLKGDYIIYKNKFHV